jgi:hypothetical protein
MRSHVAANTRCGSAAVLRSVDAALDVAREQVAHGGDEHVVGVARIDDDAADVDGLVEAEVLPGRAAVEGLPHAVARVGDAATAGAGLAGADVEDVRVARIEGERARRQAALAVEDRGEGRAAVDGLPHAAAGGADVELVGVDGIADDIGDAAADVERPALLPCAGGGEARRRHRRARLEQAGVEQRARARLEIDPPVARHPLEIEVVVLGDLVVALDDLARLAAGGGADGCDHTTREPSAICIHGPEGRREQIDGQCRSRVRHSTTCRFVMRLPSAR